MIKFENTEVLGWEAAIRGMRNPMNSWEKSDSYPAVKSILHSAKPIDAVPVVRCRECKHRGTDYCIFHIKGEPADEELLLKLDNDFCSYGERKEGAD